MTCPTATLSCPECIPPRGCEGECDDLCRLMAEMLAETEGHAAMHKAGRCSGCGIRKYDASGEPVDVSRLCRHGKCTEWCCPACGTEWGSTGPVGCPCNSSWTTRQVLRWWRIRDRIFGRSR